MPVKNSCAQAFCSVYLGWPIDVKTRPDEQDRCPFGRVTACTFKVTTTTISAIALSVCYKKRPELVQVCYALHAAVITRARL
jgi:hypothetical protein